MQTLEIHPLAVWLWHDMRYVNGKPVSDGLKEAPRRTRPGSQMVWGPMKAYVLATFGPDHERSIRKAGVECDVVLDHPERRILLNVLVSVESANRPDEVAAWRPTPAAKNLDTNQPLVMTHPSLYSETIGALPDLSALDGAYVLINFIDGRLNGATITRSMAHPRTPATVGAEQSEDWPSELEPNPASPGGYVVWRTHAGTKYGVDASGTVFVDTTEAPKTQAGEPSTLDPAAGVELNIKETSAVQIRFNGQAPLFRISDGLVEVLNGKVVIGDGAEVTMKGNKSVQWMDKHIHLQGTAAGGGPTGPPDPNSPAGLASTAGLTSDDLTIPGDA